MVSLPWRCGATGTTSSAGLGCGCGEAGRDVYAGIGCDALLVEGANVSVGGLPHRPGRSQVRGGEQDAAARADARRVRSPSADTQFGTPGPSRGAAMVTSPNSSCAADDAVSPYQANVGILAAARHVTSSSALTAPGPAAGSQTGRGAPGWPRRWHGLAAAPMSQRGHRRGSPRPYPAAPGVPRGLQVRDACRVRVTKDIRHARPSSIIASSGEPGYDGSAPRANSRMCRR